MILVGLLGLFFTGVTAQTADNRKAVRKAERAQRQQERQALDRLYHNEAVQALDKRFFMMQTDRMMLRGGQVALVDPTTNFVSLNGETATVQVGFNAASAGMNGLGGITVQGTASDITMRTDKKGYVFFDMNVVGIGISAAVEITLFPGNNSASVTVLPNFNMNRVTLAGKLIPYDGSAVIEGAPY